MLVALLDSSNASSLPRPQAAPAFVIDDARRSRALDASDLCGASVGRDVSTPSASTTKRARASRSLDAVKSSN